MRDKYFVDTNTLMYAHDAAAGEKHQVARALVEELWETRSGVVSTQVLQELAVNLRKKAKKPLGPRTTRDAVGRTAKSRCAENADTEVPAVPGLRTTTTARCPACEA